MKNKRIIPALLLLLCLLTSLTACGVRQQTNQPTEAQDASQPTRTAKNDLEPAPAEPMRAAKDYDEVKEQLLRSVLIVEDEANEWPGVVENGPQDGMEAPEEGADYSGTNVQVDGVDESDILKTDGKYIYFLCGTLLQIFRADGENTALVSEISFDGGTDEELTPLELYLNGSTLVVLAEKSVWDDGWAYGCTISTAVLVYDVTDPTKPDFQTNFTQDGDYRSSRMRDGSLYLITEKYYYDLQPEEDDRWIPRTYQNGIETKFPAEKIYLCPSSCDFSLTLISAYDCDALALTDTCSFTGAVDSVYMSKNALYLAQTLDETLSSEPYFENQYTVTDYKYVKRTQIHRIRAEDGTLQPDGSGTVDGYLLNQFAMDEYDGMLRLATTTYADAYSVYRDDAYDFENYVWHENERNNAVTVLDSDLKPLGAVTDLVADESIYSVRFTGQTAFVVTFESVDPLFTIDLSNPAKPEVQSALEVSGVSDYLHSYGDGLLFGFGEALNEDLISGGMQLSMFDTSDPKAVRLLDKVTVDDWSFESLYQHKALLISTEKNLIAFSGSDSVYYVYGFEAGSFVERGSFQINNPDDGYDNWGRSTSRGLYIDNSLYLINGQSLTVVALNGFETIAQLSFAEG